MSIVYRGLRANLEKVTVTEAEVDRQLLRLQQQAPKLTPVIGRPAALGDELVLDYAGFCGGVQFEGGTAERQTLELGSGMFIPGFEEQLVGANIGEDVVVKVTFPAQYHAEELAGKEAEFRCHVHEIRTKTLYELDDEFAREVGGVESIEAMKEAMRQNLQGYYDGRSEMELQEKLLRQAAATVEGGFTPEEEAEALEEQMRALEAQLGQKGLTVEAYCQFTGTTVEQLREDAKPEAQERLRMQRAVNQIALLEGLKATKEEMDQQLTAVCRENNMSMEQLRPYMNEQFYAAVEQSVLTYKVMSFLRDNAVVTTVEAKQSSI